MTRHAARAPAYCTPTSNVAVIVIGAPVNPGAGCSVALIVPATRDADALVTTSVPDDVAFVPPHAFTGACAVATRTVRVAPVPSV